ncbi:hypothetical protein [Acidovorax sp.]|uniref:hypothetical protein n=1 Tax=Acidovorax sp. TaxID=1872122 RepID=UPI0031E23E78
MSQMTLLPVVLVDEQPPEPGASKDLLWIGLDEQDRRYALKTVEPGHKYLPLTEWLCYHLCGLAGILTPDFAIVQRLDGSEAFGSRWEETAKQFSPGKVSDAEFIGWLNRSRADISAMFALDAFMPNDDRHLGNILFTQAGGRMRALAFDWSRTRLFAPWPWSADCNSAQVWQWLTGPTPPLVNPKETQDRMDRIQAITGQQVEAILEAAPELWRDNFDCAAAGRWWQSESSKRAEQAIKLLTP